MNNRTILTIAVLLLLLSGSAYSQGGYLGIQVNPGDGGVAISVVHPGTAAERAGLKAGDVILAVDDQEVPTTDDLVAALGGKSPGDRVVVKLRRGDRTVNAVANLGSRADRATEPPAATPPRPPTPPTPPTPEAPRRERIPAPPRTAPAGGGTLGVVLDQSDTDVVRIQQVLPGGPADRGHVRDGDVITSIDGTEVGSFDDLRSALAGRSPGDEVNVKIVRGDRERTRTVRLGSREDLERMMAAQEQSGALAPAVPSEEVEEEEAEEIQPGFLGVMIDGEGEHGALIAEVMAGGPADRAGLQAGDLIVAVDDHHVTSADDLGEVLAHHAAGSRANVVLQRGDATVRARVRLAGPEERARLMATVGEEEEIEEIQEVEPEIAVEAHGEESAPGWLGVYYEETDAGVLITETVDESPARRAGLKSGDVIVRINDQPVADADGLIHLLGKLGAGARADVHVNRDGKNAKIRVTLGHRQDTEQEAEEEEHEHEHGEEGEEAGEIEWAAKISSGHGHSDDDDHGNHDHDDVAVWTTISEGSRVEAPLIARLLGGQKAPARAAKRLRLALPDDEQAGGNYEIVKTDDGVMIIEIRSSDDGSAGDAETSCGSGHGCCCCCCCCCCKKQQHGAVEQTIVVREVGGAKRSPKAKVLFLEKDEDPKAASGRVIVRKKKSSD